MEKARRSNFVSIIITNFRGTTSLKRCLDSLYSNTNYPTYEVIVVDSLTHNVKEWLEKKYPKAMCIHFNHDIGASNSHNIGFEKSTGEFIVFLDNDTMVTPNWLIELVKVMKHDSSIGAAQSKLLSMERHKFFDYAAYPAKVNYYVETNFPETTQKFVYDKGQYDRLQEIFSAKAACVIIRRSVFVKAGGFDPVFHYGMDDPDLSWRIWLSGYRIVFVPSSIVYHGKPHSTPTTRPFSERVFFRVRNHLIMKLKNFGGNSLMRYLPVMILSTLRDSFGCVLIGDQGASIKAILWVIANLKPIWKKRLRVQKYVREVPDHYLRGSIMQKPIPPFPLHLVYGARQLLRHYRWVARCR